MKHVITIVSKFRGC